jgi:hypothetical protein
MRSIPSAMRIVARRNIFDYLNENTDGLMPKRKDKIFYGGGMLTPLDVIALGIGCFIGLMTALVTYILFHKRKEE